MKTLEEKKASLTERINSLTHHSANLKLIGGEGRLMLASQFDENVDSLKQRLYEINLEIGV